MPCYRSSPVILLHLLHRAWTEDFFFLKEVNKQIQSTFDIVLLFEFSRQKYIARCICSIRCSSISGIKRCSKVLVILPFDNKYFFATNYFLRRITFLHQITFSRQITFRNGYVTFRRFVSERPLFYYFLANSE